jgi:hypothetical protein
MGVGKMPKYISQHTLACLTRQGAEGLAARLLQADTVKTVRVMVNMMEAKMLAEFEAENREILDQWLAKNRFHSDWILRIEYE